MAKQFKVGDPVKHKDLRGHVEVAQPLPMDGQGPKYHVRWTTGDLLFYAHADLEADDE